MSGEIAGDAMTLGSIGVSSPRIAAAVPPRCETHMVPLPLCSLHVMTAGSGPPLIIVPATISELENWVDLVQFMGLWFRSHFFELPGHGASTAFSSEFSSELVAVAVGQLADRLGAERFNLMGFSFGGILAMKTYELLKHRIDRVVLLAPCVTRRALRLSAVQWVIARQLNRLLKQTNARDSLHAWVQSPGTAMLVAQALHLVGKVENRQLVATKLQRMRPSMMEVVSHELDEILTAEFQPPAARSSTPCYFAMSIRDPLLSYQTTLDELFRHFADIHVTPLNYPFHQPPRPFTFAELHRDFGSAVRSFMEEAPP